jgi:hypothetical protein
VGEVKYLVHCDKVRMTVQPYVQTLFSDCSSFSRETAFLSLNGIYVLSLVHTWAFQSQTLFDYLFSRISKEKDLELLKRFMLYYFCYRRHLNYRNCKF